MHYNEKEHPDAINDYQKFKQINVGSRQAIEDIAIDAYMAVINNGGTKQQAEEAFFKVFQNENKL